jgi:hypothetical protein
MACSSWQPLTLHTWMCGQFLFLQVSWLLKRKQMPAPSGVIRTNVNLPFLLGVSLGAAPPLPVPPVPPPLLLPLPMPLF